MTGRPPTFPPHLTNAATWLVANGIRPAEVAALVGMSRANLRYHCKKAGLADRRHLARDGSPTLGPPPPPEVLEAGGLTFERFRRPRRRRSYATGGRGV